MNEVELTTFETATSAPFEEVEGLHGEKSLEEPMTFLDKVKLRAQEELGIAIKGKIRFAFWNHRLTPKLERIINEGEHSIVCGESSPWHIINALKYEPPKDLSETLDILVSTVKKRAKNIRLGSSIHEQQVHADITQSLYEKNVAFVGTDCGTYSDLAAYLPEVQGKINQQLLAIVLLADTIGAAVLVRQFLRTKMSRRNALLLLGAGLGAGIGANALGAYSFLAGGLPDLPLPDNATPRFRFIENVSVDQTDAEKASALEANHPNPFFTKTEFGIDVRDGVMALNTWVAIERMSHNGVFSENLFYYAGMQHGKSEEVFESGPNYAMQEVRRSARQIVNPANLAVALICCSATDEYNDLYPDQHTYDTDVISTVANMVASTALSYTEPVIFKKGFEQKSYVNSSSMLFTAREIYMQELAYAIKECKASSEPWASAIYTVLNAARNQIEEKLVSDYNDMVEKLGRPLVTRFAPIDSLSSKVTAYYASEPAAFELLPDSFPIARAELRYPHQVNRQYSCTYVVGSDGPSRFINCKDTIVSPVGAVIEVADDTYDLYKILSTSDDVAFLQFVFRSNAPILVAEVDPSTGTISTPVYQRASDVVPNIGDAIYYESNKPGKIRSSMMIVKMQN